MAVVIKEVLTDRDLKEFIRFPERLYRGDTYRVPPLYMDEWNTLHKKKNPAFESCQARYWLAYKDGKTAGRIAGILNKPHIDKWKQRYLRFGWNDFIDDADVSAALFGAVEGWAREIGLEAVHGPLGFTDMDREGMLVEGFAEKSTMATIYNYPYYLPHLDRLGYQKDIDWLEYEIRLPVQPDERITRVAETVCSRYHLHLLPARKKEDILPYTKRLFDLMMEEYSHLYGYIPLTEHQVDAYIKQYFDFIDPDFVPIVLDENDRMIAFAITMPSLSRALQKARGRLFPLGFLYLLRALKKNDRADVYLGAVRSEYQGKGVNAILMDKTLKTFRRFGITTIDTLPQLETNLPVQAQWKHFEFRQHKRRRCYIKHIL